MSASSKFDASNGSADRSIFLPGQRGSYATALLEKSGSFRESSESPNLPAIPNLARGSAYSAQDVTSFFQCLRFDPKSMISDHKLNRPLDFRRLASVSLGIPLDDSLPVASKGKSSSSHSPEEFRRLKASARESLNKARERRKAINDSLSLMDKWFPTIPSRKRSRSDCLSSERSNSFYSGDRAVISKMGAQDHVSANGFEVEQKLEERIKSSVPNKRTRTSMMDPRPDARASTPVRPGTPARPSTPARLSAAADREREILKIPNSIGVLVEDRTLPVTVEGWEKSKMKKKRSGIKPDLAASSAAAKSVDGSRDSKLGMQPRLLNEARSRMADAHGFRPGVSNGGVSKVDGGSQQIGLGMRTLLPRPEQDSSPILHEKRDHSAEKERVIMKAINKTSGREDFNSGSPTSSTKLNSSARAPRSGSGVRPKLSPVVSRANNANDWDVSQCTNKLPGSGGLNNRKRTPSMRSSSPPAAHWPRQRPQKISRTARRTNMVPIVHNNDESSTFDIASIVIGNEGLSSGNSPQHVKLKNDQLSSAGLSESEESEASEMKLKDKIKKPDDLSEKSWQNVQKMSNLLLPPRKNKVIGGEDHGDGARRQGRTNRGFSATRTVMPLAGGKLGNVGTAKQLRSTKLGFDKVESKPGRPTRKLSDRKAYTRKHTTVNAPADFLADGHEELLAASKAVTNPAQALSSSFWKQMESLFRFLTDTDFSFLSQQIDSEPTVIPPGPASLGIKNANLMAFGFHNDEVGSRAKTLSVKYSQDHLVPGGKNVHPMPLFQRLISALIPEEDEEYSCGGNQDLCFDGYESGFDPDTSVKRESNHPQFLQGYDLSGFHAPDGYKANACRGSFNDLEHITQHDYSLSNPEAVILGNDGSRNGFVTEKAVIPSNCKEIQYNNMSTNERLLLEIHCIGIFPEPVPDSTHSGDEDLSAEINKLNNMYHEQVLKRKGLLGRLLVSANEMREVQYKEFEQHALDKLVVMAYEKYMACWGPNAHGMKSASGKMAKQAALAFVKRTLERCQEFQETGKSCFDESIFRDIFLAGCSSLGEQATESIGDAECSKPEVRLSASLGAQQSPSLPNQETYTVGNLAPGIIPLEQISAQEESWSNRVKKKELLLDDVGGGASGTSLGIIPGTGSPFTSSAKGKRSERDREGKCSGREIMSRSGTTKMGRPIANASGERKNKTKPKQKTTQLSASVNGLLGKMSEKPKGTSPFTQKANNASSSGTGKGNSDLGLDDLEDPIDLSGLQIPEMDDFGIPDDFGGQAQDIGSWLNIDDDGLQDDILMGLDIPMDDISDLKMMV